MLQHIPNRIGRWLKNLRPGPDKLVCNDPVFRNVQQRLEVMSPVFSDGNPIPVDYTDDGKKISPPLLWRGVPPQAKSLVLIVEDPDSPTPVPLTHAIATDLPGANDGLPAGAVDRYLPPDPPPGHGPHRYTFELFALNTALNLPEHPTKGVVKDAMRGHVLAKGTLTGIYERS